MTALLPFFYFALHGSGDWFWEIPALGAPAVGFLGLAVRLAAGPGQGATGRAAPRWALPAVQSSSWRSSLCPGCPHVGRHPWPPGTGRRGSRSPMTGSGSPTVSTRSRDQPAETEGLIAARAGDPQRARRAFARAISRNP